MPGNGRNRRFFLVTGPVFLTIILLSLFVFNQLNMLKTEGPRAGEPTFPAGLLMVAAIVSIISAINGRLENVKSVKLEKDKVKWPPR